MICKILFLLLIGRFSFGFVLETIPITCNPKKVSYSYINGINTESKIVADGSSKVLKKELKTKMEVMSAYNQTHGMARDLLDATIQKAEEASGFIKFTGKIWQKTNVGFIDNRVSVIEQLTEHRKGSDDHIIFSHSQGNLYANIACEHFKSEGKSFKNIQLASPASVISCGNKNDYVTIDQDEVYLLVANAIDLTTLKEMSKNRMYQNFIEELTLLKFVLIPPMKANVSQRRPANIPFSAFEIHSVDNYLSYPPAVDRLKRIYSKMEKTLEPTKKVFESKQVNVDCSNIESFAGQELLFWSEYSILGIKKMPQFIHTYSIEKTDVPGEYIFVDEFRLFLFILAMIPVILMAPFLLRALALFAKEADRVAKEEEARRRNR